MNKQWISFHLREAHEELTRTIYMLETDANVEDMEFQVAVTHVYHHLNTAWNSRNVDEEPAAVHSEQEFYEWRRFPVDIPLA